MVTMLHIVMEREVVQDPANPSKSNSINGHDATWSYFYVGDKSDALKGQEYIYPSQRTGKQVYETYTAYDGTSNEVGVYLPNSVMKMVKIIRLFI